MRGGPGRGVRTVLGVLLAVVLGVATAGCGGSGPTNTALPTFAGSLGGPTTSAASDQGAIPNDCERLLRSSELNALLGLPLDTVAVRTTQGVPEPSVGRTERVACHYTGKGAGAGRTLLDINAAAYDSPADARTQWHRNADIEDGVHRDLPIGGAGAVLVERGGEALLSVVYGPSTLTLILPDQPLPGGKPPSEVLVDLALRVLPAVAPRATAPRSPAGSAPTAAAATSGRSAAKPQPLAGGQ